MAKITGDRHSNTLRGTRHNDIIHGKGGHDTLKGYAGHDKLHGDAGGDVLIGGKGPDQLWGGSGADIFKFNDGDGFFHSATSTYDDVIYDFQDDVDKFDLPGSDFSSVTSSGDTVDPVLGAGFHINYGTSSSVFVVGFSSAQFNPGDFVI